MLGSEQAAKGGHWQLKERREGSKTPGNRKSRGRGVIPNALVLSKNKIIMHIQERTGPRRDSQSSFQNQTKREEMMNGEVEGVGDGMPC